MSEVMLTADQQAALVEHVKEMRRAMKRLHDSYVGSLNVGGVDYVTIRKDALQEARWTSTGNALEQLFLAPPAGEPMQPIYVQDGVVRFKENRLVRYLLDAGGLDLNKLCVAFSTEEHAADWRQLAQLIGYSVSGYGGLSYAQGHSSVEAADQIAARLLESQKGGA